MDRQATHDELARVRADFRRLVAQLDGEALDRPSVGTRWTNRQLLFHLVFGYLIVVRLLWMVKLVSLLPPSVSRLLARLLNAPRRPFDVLNYLAPCIGARLLDPTRMVRLMDRGTASLAARLAREPDERLAQGMHYPTRWEPFFEDYLTVAQTYEYPTKHYDFHRAQLNLTPQTR